MRLGEGNANHVQQYQTIATLLSGFLGGTTSSSTESKQDESSGVPKNYEDAQRRLAAVFGKR